MSETPSSNEPVTGPVATTPPPPPPAYVPPAPDHRPAPRDHKGNKLYKAAAWVVIVAGVVFIVAVIFFSGFALGRHSGGGSFGGHHRYTEFQQRMPMAPMERQGPPIVFPGGPAFQLPQPPQAPGGGPTTTPTRP